MCFEESDSVCFVLPASGTTVKSRYMQPVDKPSLSKVLHCVLNFSSHVYDLCICFLCDVSECLPNRVYLNSLISQNLIKSFG